MAHEVAEGRGKEGDLDGEREEALLGLGGPEFVDRLDVGDEGPDQGELLLPVGDALLVGEAGLGQGVEELVRLRVAECGVEREEAVQERRPAPRQPHNEDRRRSRPARRGRRLPLLHGVDDPQPHDEAPHEVVERHEATERRRPRFREAVDGQREELWEGVARAPVAQACAPLRDAHQRVQGQGHAQHVADDGHAVAEPILEEAGQDEPEVHDLERGAAPHGDDVRRSTGAPQDQDRRRDDDGDDDEGHDHGVFLPQPQKFSL